MLEEITMNYSVVAIIVFIAISSIGCKSYNSADSALLDKYRISADYIRLDTTTVQQFARKWGKPGEPGVMVADSIVCLPTEFMIENLIEWRYNINRRDQPKQFNELWKQEIVRYYKEDTACKSYYWSDLGLLNSGDKAGLIVHFSAPNGEFLLAKVMGTYTEDGERRELWSYQESLFYIFFFDKDNTLKGVKSALFIK